MNQISLSLWFFIISFILINVGLYHIIPTSFALEGLFLYPFLFIVSGITLSAYSFGKFSKKELMVSVIVIVFSIFISIVIRDELWIQWITGANVNPNFYDTEYYFMNFLYLFSLIIGTVLGIGLKKLFNKINKKTV